MTLRFVCIEVRHSLRCANVFLQFDHSLTETDFLKIVVDNDALTFREYSTATRVSLSKYFTAEARTISNLTVEECNASFRLTITNDCEQATTANGEKQTDKQRKIGITPKPDVEEGGELKVVCKNCKCELCTTLKCQRVREFPSGSIDVSEFFCHHGPKFDEVLVPQLTDFFYGFQFIVLNTELMQERVKLKNEHVYCRRCLQYLGENILNNKAVKIWMDTLLLKHQTENEADITVNLLNKYDITPTCQLLHKIIDDTDVGGESIFRNLHFCKVLLEAIFPNRERKFLLLQVLEKQLQVLRNSTPLAHGSHNNNNVLQVELEQFKCFKLLYRILDDTEDEGGGENRVEKGNDDGDNASNGSSASIDNVLLKSWKEDMSIHVLKISPTLFNTLLNELDVNALLLPELYRYTQDYFQLSYIFYEE
ncbi:uncharacterized protein LOC101448454 [Ceratitis capitata]|uniref:uncharacterized protein LOC101448454 n=1 Tax=Ceratitis capitata TaxID=7213 RepID=UPI000329A260|nr:uncharacterized protein LOC101448454 [Ceratitis capitata]